MMIYIVFVDIDDCVSNPCLNGGACVDGVNGWTCDCGPTFTGYNCADGNVIYYPFFILNDKIVIYIAFC